MAIKVMIVDDSNFMRRSIELLLSSDPRIKVVSAMGSGEDAIADLPVSRPDVITLDIELPGMDGLTTLESIMKTQPTPVVMFSAYSKKGAEVTLKALKGGAIDFIQKPSGTVSLDLAKVRDSLIEKVIAASHAKSSFRRKEAAAARPQPVSKELRLKNAERSILFITSSTGGVQALSRVVPMLPADFPLPVVIVQHMPPLFTQSLASSLNGSSSLLVKEAENGELIKRGLVYIAPGGWQTKVVKAESGTRIMLDKSSAGNRLKPCANVTMESIASVYGGDILAVVLTGMGDDGTVGAGAIKKNGGHVIAQDESTSIIFGMPRSVIETGSADIISPLDEIAGHIISMI